MKTYNDALKDPEFWTWVSFCINDNEFISEYERLKGPIRATKKLKKKVFDDFTKFCFDLWVRLPDEVV